MDIAADLSFYHRKPSPRYAERQFLAAPAAQLVVRPFMSMLNVKKLANALIPNATPSDDIVPSIALWGVDRFKRKQGGLWVGGTVFVSELGVSFTPNSLNQTFHEELQVVDVPAKDIRKVRHEFGWFTGIVVVEHASGEFRFRCYGAKGLATEMEQCFNAA